MQLAGKKGMKAPYMTNQINRLQCGSRPLGGTVALLRSSWSVYLNPVSICFHSGFLSPALSILFFFLSLLSSFCPQLFASLSPLFSLSFSYTDSVQKKKKKKPRGQSTSRLTCLLATFLICIFYPPWAFRFTIHIALPAFSGIRTCGCSAKHSSNPANRVGSL